MGSSEDSRGGRDRLHGFRRDLRTRRSGRPPAAGSPLVTHRVVPTPDLAATWTAIQRELRATVTDSTYHLWLEPLRLEAVGGPRPLVGGPRGAPPTACAPGSPTATPGFSRPAPRRSRGFDPRSSSCRSARATSRLRPRRAPPNALHPTASRRAVSPSTPSTRSSSS